MIDASRRGFLFGAGAILLADPKLIVSRIPRLYGDGLRDDWEGLDALFNGRTVKLPDGDTFAPGERPSLVGGRYLSTKPLQMGVPFDLLSAQLVFEGVWNGALLNVGPMRSQDGSTIAHCHIDGSRVRRTADHALGIAWKSA